MTIKGIIASIAAIGLAGAVTVNAEDPAPPKWQSSAAAGITLTRGNSSTLLATLSATTAKKWDKNEISLGADAAYGTAKNNGTTTRNSDSLHGFMQYNRLFTERLYGYARADGLHDQIAAINYRVTLSPGVGYYLIKEKKTDLSVEFGPGYIFERLSNTNKNFAVLRVAEKFHHELSDRSRVWESAEWLPQVDKFNNYIINAEVGIEADLTADKKMTLRALLQDTYNHVPAAGRQKNDAKLVTALAYKF